MIPEDKLKIQYLIEINIKMQKHNYLNFSENLIQSNKSYGI